MAADSDFRGFLFITNGTICNKYAKNDRLSDETETVETKRIVAAEIRDNQVKDLTLTSQIKLPSKSKYVRNTLCYIYVYVLVLSRIHGGDY